MGVLWAGTAEETLWDGEGWFLFCKGTQCIDRVAYGRHEYGGWCCWEAGYQQKDAAKKTVGWGYFFPEAVEQHKGAFGEELPSQYRYEQRWYSVSAWLSGDQLIPAGV